MNDRHEPDDLLPALIAAAAERLEIMLMKPNAAAKFRQLGLDKLSEIQRLEVSPMAEDQLVAVGLRLAGSRTGRGNISDHLSGYFSKPASSLEIEAQRRSIWKLNRNGGTEKHEAATAASRIENMISQSALPMAEQMRNWAALYADMWCDPRIGATSHARRVMLAMVTLLHERSHASIR